MSSLVLDGGEEEEEESLVLSIEEPVDVRPDLSSIGINEYDRGVCEDSFLNRKILRKNHLTYYPLLDSNGRVTNLIYVLSLEAQAEYRKKRIEEDSVLLTDQSNPNCDYLTGLDLVLDDAAVMAAPSWVISATKAWLKEQNEGGPSSVRVQPKTLPRRCLYIMDDGIRCRRWTSGRIGMSGLCTSHIKRKTLSPNLLEMARRKLLQAAPYAVDVLEDLMENAKSEPVKLKATTEILDRAGIRSGQDVTIDVDVRVSSDPYKVIQERLNNLSKRVEVDNFIDAEIVEESDADDTHRN